MVLVQAGTFAVSALCLLGIRAREDAPTRTFAQPGWWTLLIVVGIAAGEFGHIVYAITQVSVRQQVCPDRMLGRVNATTEVVVMGLSPLGAITGGVLGDAIRPRWTLIPTGTLLVLWRALLWRALRGVRDVSDLPEAASVELPPSV